MPYICSAPALHHARGRAGPAERGIEMPDRHYPVMLLTSGLRLGYREYVMKTLCRTVLIALILVMAGGRSALSASDAAHLITINGHLCANNRVIIKLSDAATRKDPRGRTELAVRDLERILQLPAGVRVRESGFDQWSRGQKAGGQNRKMESINLEASHLIVHLDKSVTVPEMLEHLRRHPWIEYAEPDGVGFGGGIPSDPSYALQWHHETIQSTGAWASTTGSTNVIVAVLDSGIDLSEAEFAGRLVPGYNFVSDNNDPSDDHGHGTAVAGVLAANANNDRLVAGVDWTCMLMPVKVLNSGNWGYYSWWADGINYAVANGAKIINLSAGGSGSLTALTDAIRHAVSNEVVFVTITHNHSSGIITYPGNLPESITVGATDSNDVRSSFSNWGDEIDLVAPGTNIYTVGLSGNLEHWWGTSFSAPQVAGVAALLASVCPSFDQETARTLLCAGAEDQVGDASDVPGWDPYYGWGRLNAAYSIQLALTEANASVAPDASGAVLTWKATGHAPDRHPYRVLYSADLFSWVTLTNHSAITFTGGEARWTDDGSETGSFPPVENRRYYRVLITR